MAHGEVGLHLAGLELRLEEGTAIWPWSFTNFGGHQGHQAGHQGQMFLYGRARRPFLEVVDFCSELISVYSGSTRPTLLLLRG